LFRSAGLDLNFAGGVFSLNNTRTDSPANIPGWSFSRTDTNGTATALDLAGNVIQFATGVPRITNRGILVEEARTNQLAISNANPLTTASVFGYNGATVTVENRPDLIAAAGLSGICTSGNVFKVVCPISDSGVNIGSNLPTAGVATAVSAFVCTEAGAVAQVLTENASGLGTIGQTTSPTMIRVSSAGTLVNNTRLRVRTTSAGGTLYFILPQLEYGAFATSPIITTGAAGTRGADAASIVLPSNVSSFAATYNNGTTATGVVTPGATFDLVTARAWLNGYLQRFRVT
jgi:hypothetical protein